MRYAIFSDIHSNLEALRAVIAACKKESPDKYLCVGDVIGYGANPNECIEEVKRLSGAVVAGNHDWAAVSLFSLDYFNPAAQEAVLWTRRSLSEEHHSFLESLKLVFSNDDLTLVHGTLDNPRDFNYLTDGFIAEETFRLMQLDLCFVGHTHLPGIFIKSKEESLYYSKDSQLSVNPGNKYIVNVGSVGQPRDKDPRAAYCIYDTDAKKLVIKRASYDYKAARQKIIACGLPKSLGDRLLAGK